MQILVNTLAIFVLLFTATSRTSFAETRHLNGKVIIGEIPTATAPGPRGSARTPKRPTSSNATVFKNISTLKTSLSFDRYYNSGKRARALKVAVFDKGFLGYKTEIGSSLPANTVYIPGPVAAPPELNTEHGFRMAQILTALATDSMRDPSVIHEFYLYNVYGFSNFKAAVDDAIRRKVDVISYSEIWEFGGNHDGRGFINAQVSRATAAGITWVNAAGNFNLTTYNGGITTGKDDWVVLPDHNQSLGLRCKADKGYTCKIKAVLSWNDFKDNVDIGTDKDLDFALTDDLLNVVESSSLHQTTAREEQPGTSKYPRETIIAEIKPGQYFFRVKNRSQNFTSMDRLRITVDGEQISMPSHSSGETLSNPADNPNVITVGALDADRSGVSKRLGKPNILTTSSVVLQDGREFRGSSNATAIVAAAIVLAKSQNPALRSNEDIIQAISFSYDWSRGGLSLRDLYFGPIDGNSCFHPLEWPEAPDYIRQVLNRGGVLVETTQGVRIMTPFDPLTLTSNVRRRFANDMVLLLPDGSLGVLARGGQAPEGSSEVFQRPLEAGLCDTETKIVR